MDEDVAVPEVAGVARAEPAEASCIATLGKRLGIGILVISAFGNVIVGIALVSGRWSLRGTENTPALIVVVVALIFMIGGIKPPAWLANTTELIGGGLFSLAAVVAVAMLVPESRMDRAPQAAITSPAEKWQLRRLAVAYGLFGFGYVITATFIVAIVRGSPEIGSFEPFVWLVVGLAAVPSVSAWTMLARRHGVTRAFAIACIVEAIGVVCSVVWISIPGLFVAAAFLGGTFMGITALGLMAARALSGDDPRRGLATMTAAFGLGQIIGPLVAGYGFDLTGSFLLPSLMAAAGLCISAGLAIYLGRQQETF